MGYAKSYQIEMEKTLVHVRLPLNLRLQDQGLFTPKQEYFISPLKILYLKHVFVSYSGLCVSQEGLVEESHHASKEDYESFLQDASYYYHQAQNNQGELEVLEDDSLYLLIHSPWHNYYHWICDTLLRLWVVRNRLSQMILLLPEHFLTINWVTESLQFFQFKDIFHIPGQSSLLVKNLCLPQVKPDCHSYHKGLVLEMQDFFLKNVLQVGSRSILDRPMKKLYVSRRKAARRKIANEKQLIDLLECSGFTILDCENLSFLEQVRLFSESQLLLSIHGAGLTNMMWMSKGSTVFELHKRKTRSDDRHSLVYWYLADSLGHNYIQQVCDPVDQEEDFFTANLFVDLERLKLNLDYLVKINLL